VCSPAIAAPDARSDPRLKLAPPSPTPRPRPQTPLRDRPNPADKKDDLVNANSDALKKTVARANQIFENGARAPGGVPRAPRPPGLPRATERTGPTHTRPHPPRASRAPSRARLPEGLRINPIVLPRPPRTRAQS
jgi:hypothetical protein